MSWLSKVTGIGINPLKGQVKIDPLKAIGTIAGVATGGLSGLATGALGALGSGVIKNALPDSMAHAIPDDALGIDDGGFSLGGALKSGAGKVGDFLTGNHGLNALGVAQGINTALQQRQADQLSKKALQTTEADYASRAPLRAAGLAGVNTARMGNPYATGVTNPSYGS